MNSLMILKGNLKQTHGQHVLGGFNPVEINK